MGSLAGLRGQRGNQVFEMTQQSKSVLAEFSTCVVIKQGAHELESKVESGAHQAAHANFSFAKSVIGNTFPINSGPLSPNAEFLFGAHRDTKSKGGSATTCPHLSHSWLEPHFAIISDAMVKFHSLLRWHFNAMIRENPGKDFVYADFMRTIEEYHLSNEVSDEEDDGVEEELEVLNKSQAEGEESLKINLFNSKHSDSKVFVEDGAHVNLVVESISCKLCVSAKMDQPHMLSAPFSSNEGIKLAAHVTCEVESNSSVNGIEPSPRKDHAGALVASKPLNYSKMDQPHMDPVPLSSKVGIKLAAHALCPKVAHAADTLALDLQPASNCLISVVDVESANPNDQNFNSAFKTLSSGEATNTQLHCAENVKKCTAVQSTCRPRHGQAWEECKVGLPLGKHQQSGRPQDFDPCSLNISLDNRVEGDSPRRPRQGCALDECQVSLPFAKHQPLGGPLGVDPSLSLNTILRKPRIATPIKLPIQPTIGLGFSSAGPTIPCLPLVEDPLLGCPTPEVAFGDSSKSKDAAGMLIHTAGIVKASSQDAAEIVKPAQTAFESNGANWKSIISAGLEKIDGGLPLVMNKQGGGPPLVDNSAQLRCQLTGGFESEDVGFLNVLAAHVPKLSDQSTNLLGVDNSNAAGPNILCRAPCLVEGKESSPTNCNLFCDSNLGGKHGPFCYGS